jgi:hypothetical protein
MRRGLGFAKIVALDYKWLNGYDPQIAQIDADFLKVGCVIFLDSPYKRGEEIFKICLWLFNLR